MGLLILKDCEMATTIIVTSGGWVARSDLPVTQPIPLEDVLNRQYPFVASPDPDGGFGILFPDLPGCMSFAETWEDIGRQAREASALWLEGEWYDNHPIPDPTYEWEPFEHDHSVPISRLDGLPEPAHERIFTAEDVAEALGITRGRVHQIARELGVGTKVNNARLFTASELDTLRLRTDRRMRSDREDTAREDTASEEPSGRSGSRSGATLAPAAK